MDTLLFLGAVFAIGFVTIRFIVEDGRRKSGAAPANATRTSLLQDQGEKPRKRWPRV